MLFFSHLIPARRALPQAAWWGVFHAISAFNNAGFDRRRVPQSVPFNQQPVILLPIAACSCAAASRTRLSRN